HNGNLVNAADIRKRFERQGSIFQTTSDSEIILHLIAHSLEQSVTEAIGDALRRVEGACSVVLITPDAIYAARDPRGFRPLCMGRMPSPDGGEVIAFASETCAFDLIGVSYERDVNPGELVAVNASGVHSQYYAPALPQSKCIFEHVYFSRPDSRIFGGVPVQDAREAMGRQVAREAPAAADIVVPVPDSGVTAAMGYSIESGIPLQFGLIRNHYVGRTFIEPEQRVRDFGVKLKLNPVRSLLQGKRVVLFDDSIVRGTTSRKIVRMIRDAGAKEVHMRISCPPTISPCYYGVDTPTRGQLIASSKTVEEIRDFIGADSLAYLSLKGLRLACGENPDEPSSFCTSCYTGKYPTDWVEVHEIRPAEPVQEVNTVVSTR
ncbi:MAG: amidophosphoribosyltransferase, partial [Candidatus Korobacteraceae bacterium]